MAKDIKETDGNRIDPFGIPKRKICEQDLSNPYVETWELELDKETGATKAVLGEPVNFVEEIQTFKDQCGVDAMMRDIAMGRALPQQFADDGQHGGDFTRPTMISEATNELIAKEVAAQLAAKDSEAKGIDTNEIIKDGADIEAIVTRLVNQKLGLAESAKIDQKEEVKK